MDKNRLETQKEIVYLDYTNRHDTPQMYFTVDDLKWLIMQAEKVERYEKALKDITSVPRDWSESYDQAYPACLKIALKALEIK